MGNKEKHTRTYTPAGDPSRWHAYRGISNNHFYVRFLLFEEHTRSLKWHNIIRVLLIDIQLIRVLINIQRAKQLNPHTLYPCLPANVPPVPVENVIASTLPWVCSQISGPVVSMCALRFAVLSNYSLKNAPALLMRKKAVWNSDYHLKKKYLVCPDCVVQTFCKSFCLKRKRDASRSVSVGDGWRVYTDE